MEEHEGRLINIRKLVALDITLHSPRFILIEFGVGTPVIILVGLWIMLTSTVFILGLYLLLTGINYMPALLYAIVLAGSGSAKIEVEYGLAHNKHYVRKYSLQQLMIFIPLAVLLIAIAQEIASRKNSTL
jgi:hypothetical protein